MRVWSQRLSEGAHVAADIASVAWRRFLCGPVGSMGLARWVATWAAYVFFALLAVATVLHERPHQVTLWWLLLLAWLASNVASSAREQKRHDPKAWMLVAVVFLVSGMAVPFAWYSVGLFLLIAAAIHSRPVEWAALFVGRVAGWGTAALAWLCAWALLVNVSLAALEPVTRAVKPRGSSVLISVLSGVSAVFSTGAALAMLWLLLRRYRRFREQLRSGDLT